MQFSLDSDHPYPFNLCYCSICRKTAGGGGYAINLGATHGTLAVCGLAADPLAMNGEVIDRLIFHHSSFWIELIKLKSIQKVEQKKIKKHQSNPIFL